MNLTSHEYGSVLDRESVDNRIIDVVFKVEREGFVKVVPIFAKQQRGEMAKWLIENNITDPEDIKKYTKDGFKFVERESSNNQFLFFRDTR